MTKQIKLTDIIQFVFIPATVYIRRLAPLTIQRYVHK